MIDDRIDHHLDLAADERSFFVIADDMKHPIVREQEGGTSRQARQEAVHHGDAAARWSWLSLVEPDFQLLKRQRFGTFGSSHAAARCISACSRFQFEGRRRSRQLDYNSPDTMHSMNRPSQVQSRSR
jgi:hypothetical protein